MFAPRGWLKRPVPRMMYRTLEQSELFDEKWYRNTQLSPLEKLVDPLWHYLDTGWKKGLNPSPNFDTNYYLRHNPDVKDLGLNPLFHYLKYGIGEQRHPVHTSLQALHTMIGPAAPLTLLSTPEGSPSRITVVLDDFTPRDSGLPYARVLITALATAKLSSAGLRILDRRSFADDMGICDIARLSGISSSYGYEYKSVGVRNDNHDVPAYPNEVFLATSWSSAYSLLASTSHDNVRYLQSDDESRFFGDSDKASHATYVVATLAPTAILVDSALSAQQAKDAKKQSVVQWKSTWTGESKRSTPGSAPKTRILVDLDTQASGQRVGLTLEALTTAAARGIVTGASHDIVILSSDHTPFSLLASLDPEIVECATVSDLTKVASECDVFVSLARPRSLGFLEHAVLATGASVISRYQGSHLSSGRLLSVDADPESIVGALREALSRATGSTPHTTLTMTAEMSGSV